MALSIKCITFFCACGPDLVMLGVGYHHAGLDMSDRKLIERAFTLADLPVLCETKNDLCAVVNGYVSI